MRCIGVRFGTVFRGDVASYVNVTELFIFLVAMCSWDELAAQDSTVSRTPQVQTSSTVSQGVEIREAYIRAKQEADVATLEQGQLSKFHAVEGDFLKTGSLIAQLDDGIAKLALDLATIEVQILEKETQESNSIAIAESALTESRKLLEQVKIDAESARSGADAKYSVQQAENDATAGEENLQRAADARREFRSSISDQQLANLTLARDQSLLKLEQARHSQTLLDLQARAKAAAIGQQEAAVKRLEDTLTKVRGDHSTSFLKLASLNKQRDIAGERLNRRRIPAPFDGMIVERFIEEGEWADAGKPVARLVRLDILQVEGFADASKINISCRGRKVKVRCENVALNNEIEGKLTFISPEVDRVNQQVHVVAEIPNVELKLLPGLPARMWVLPESSN